MASELGIHHALDHHRHGERDTVGNHQQHHENRVLGEHLFREERVQLPVLEDFSGFLFKVFPGGGNQHATGERAFSFLKGDNFHPRCGVHNMYAVFTDAYQHHIVGVVPVQNSWLADIAQLFQRVSFVRPDVHAFCHEKVAHLEHAQAFTPGFGNEAQIRYRLIPPVMLQYGRADT